MTYKLLPNVDDDPGDNGSSDQKNHVPPDRGVPSPHKSLASLPRSYIISKYFSHDSDQGRGWALLGLRMIPDPGAPCYKKAPWAVHFEVKTIDIARLMREGFFWSTESILPEEGFISRETKPGWTNFGFRHKRTWILTDKSDEEVPSWVGYLEVITRSPEILPSFRVQDLTRENIYAASAWNGLDQLVYDYHYRWPQKSYNCIYDDKPLQGWWPWPKEDPSFASSAVLGRGVRMGKPSIYSYLRSTYIYQSVLGVLGY